MMESIAVSKNNDPRLLARSNPVPEEIKEEKKESDKSLQTPKLKIEIKNSSK